MTTNLGCCFGGCTNPVIGQCGGFKDKCGQFYCLEHSRQKLCFQCAQEKASDEIKLSQEAELQRIFLKYEALAQSVSDRSFRDFRAPVSKQLREIAFMIVPSAICFSLSTSTEAPIFLIPCVIWPILFFFLVVNRDTNALVARRREFLKTEIARITDDNPGFDEFYREWGNYQAAKATEELKRKAKISLGLTLGLGLAAHQLSEKAEERQLRRDVRNKLDKM